MSLVLNAANASTFDWNDFVIAILVISILAVIWLAWRYGVDKINRWVKYALEVMTIVAIVVSAFGIRTVNHSSDLSIVKADLAYIGLSTVVALGVAFLVIFEGLSETWPTALMWGSACFACGAVLGLIFGIPQYIDTKQGSGASPTGSLVSAQAELGKAQTAAKTAQDAFDKVQKEALADSQPGAGDGKQIHDAKVDAAKRDRDNANASLAAADYEVMLWSSNREQLEVLKAQAQRGVDDAQVAVQQAKNAVDAAAKALDDAKKKLEDANKGKVEADIATAQKSESEAETAWKNAQDASDKVVGPLLARKADALGRIKRVSEIEDEQAKQKTPGYGANTNLTDISDWLTKIIVGVGLVQLAKIRGLLKSAANFIAGGLGSAPPTPAPQPAGPDAPLPAVPSHAALDAPALPPGGAAPDASLTAPVLPPAAIAPAAPMPPNPPVSPAPAPAPAAGSLLPSMALGIILFFFATGFLSSYLLARVWLPGLLAGAG